jgi:hypothetical protein
LPRRPESGRDFLRNDDNGRIASGDEGFRNDVDMEFEGEKGTGILTSGCALLRMVIRGEEDALATV